MPGLTSAQRLAAYRDELTAAGFDDDTAGRIVEQAAPKLIEDVEIQADLDDTTPGAIGEVTVRFTPSIDREELSRVIGQVHRRALFEQRRAAGTEVHGSVRFASGGVMPGVPGPPPPPAR